MKEKKGAEQAKTLDKDQFIQKQKEKKAAEQNKEQLDPTVMKHLTFPEKLALIK